MINEIVTTTFTVEVIAGLEIPDELRHLPHSRVTFAQRRYPDVVDVITFHVPDGLEPRVVRTMLDKYLPEILHYARPFMPMEVAP